VDETSDAPSAPAPPRSITSNDDAPSVGFDGLYGLNVDMTESREPYNAGAGLQACRDDAGTRATEAKFVWRHDWNDANGPRRMGMTNEPCYPSPLTAAFILLFNSDATRVRLPGAYLN